MQALREGPFHFRRLDTVNALMDPPLGPDPKLSNRHRLHKTYVSGGLTYSVFMKVQTGEEIWPLFY